MTCTPRFPTARLFTALAILMAGATAQAGAPLVGLDGVGGIAFNPLAYLAGTPTEGSVIAKPIMGMWFIGLGNAHIDWTCVGMATSLAKRVEVSYGFETVAIDGVANVHKDTVAAKVLVLPENSGGDWVPAVSVGIKHKNTSFHRADPMSSNANDFYLVATKLTTGLGLPVLFSAGVQSTQELVTGVIGFNKDRNIIEFANIDVIPASWLVVGFEYRGGTSYGSSAVPANYKDAPDWNLHAGIFATKQMTVAVAYTNTGSNTAGVNPVAQPGPNPKIGFGGGFVVSMQYTF